MKWYDMRLSNFLTMYLELCMNMDTKSVYIALNTRTSGNGHIRVKGNDSSSLNVSRTTI